MVSIRENSQDGIYVQTIKQPLIRPAVIKKNHPQLSLALKISLLINIEMPTILTFMIRKNKVLGLSEPEKKFLATAGIISCSAELNIKKFL